ncbi:MAG: Fe-S assembly protein IscX [Alphaproteobacteria bacterium 33-17]|nr:MAG: Fe-S assembly protein IscX [Alphaproteobacteria bacterium 33-17]
MRLCWTDVEEIVEALEEEHHDVDIMSLRFTTLHKLVTELEDFYDDPARSNEKVLEAIQAEWYELRENS